MTWEQTFGTEEPAPVEPRPPRRRRRGLVALVVVLIVLAVLVVLAVVADMIARSFAESAAKTAISEKLPDSVTGDVDVSIGGFSFLAQYLSGSFDEVTLDAPKLEVKGVPVDAHLVATGVPTDFDKPVASVRSTFVLSQAAVNQVVDIPGSGDLTLSDGAAAYEGTLDFLGVTIGYTVSAGVTVAPGNSVVFTPKSVQLSSGTTVFDAGEALSGIQNTKIPVCVADRLPKALQLTGLQIGNGSATVDVEAKDLPLNSDSLNQLGSCPAS